MDNQKLQSNKEYLRRNLDLNPHFIEAYFKVYDNHVKKLEDALRQAERESDLLRIRYLIGMLDGVHSALSIIEGIKLREEVNLKPKSPTSTGSLLSMLGFKR